MPAIGFGDTVRIVDAPETRAPGLAGLQGSVFGFATPSVTGVDVVGEGATDEAINVWFATLDLSVWFAPPLVEFVSHDPGMVVSVDASPNELVRQTDGSWLERSPQTRRPWWRRILGA